VRRGVLIAYILSNTSNAEGMGSLHLVELADKACIPLHDLTSLAPGVRYYPHT
jgi:hypothetical protein